MSVTTTAPPARTVDERLLIACGLSWMGAVIHVLAAAGHLDEWLPYPVFFVLLAAAQAWWGIAVYRNPASRSRLRAGAVLSLLVAAVWIVSRTSGLPIGPERWAPESVGTLDVVATADELMLAVLVGIQLHTRPLGRSGRVAATVCAGFGLCLVLLSSLALIGGHVH